MRFLLVSFAFCLSLTVAIAQQPLPAEGDESELLAVLKSDAELFDKAKVCQRLAIIGTAESVPVLAELLGDDQLAHYARFGLESNPAPEVDAAFRTALGELKGRRLVGVINSVGVRHDEQAVDALIELADGDEKEVAAAAIAALGAITTPDAVARVVKELDGDEASRINAADAGLTAADRLLTAGKNAEAAAVLAALRAADLPKHIDVAARFGQIRAEEGNVLALMKEYLAADDRDLFRIGLELAHELSGKESTSELLQQLKSSPDNRRVLLLDVIGSRGDTSALPAVLQAMRGGNGEIRVAAISVLGELGDVSVVPVLLEAAVSGDETLSQAARNSLAELGGEQVDAALEEALAENEGQLRAVVVESIGRRGIVAAIPTLLDLMESADDEATRSATIEALAMTVGAKELPEMLDRLADPDGGGVDSALKDALQKACQRMPDRDAAATLLFARIDGASADTKPVLLDLMIYVGGTKALEGIGELANGDDVALADAATQALGKWLTPDVAPVLLDLAQQGNERFRIRCLRGYIRVIRQFGLRSGQRLQMSKKAFAAATRDEERKLVLDSLTRFPSGAGLRMIVPHLKDPALKDEAAKAAVAICEKIVNTDRKAVVATMPKVMAAIDDEDLAKRAKVVMSQAGIE